MPVERTGFGSAKESQIITIWVFKKVFSVKAIYSVVINLHKCGYSSKLSRNNNKWLFQFNLSHVFVSKYSFGKNKFREKSIGQSKEIKQNKTGPKNFDSCSAWYLTAMTKILFQEGKWMSTGLGICPTLIIS